VAAQECHRERGNLWRRKLCGNSASKEPPEPFRAAEGSSGSETSQQRAACRSSSFLLRDFHSEQATDHIRRPHEMVVESDSTGRALEFMPIL